MNHASLFSGIGGFDYAAEKMGWGNMFHCEFADFPKQILKYYWPKAVSYGDIKQTDFTIWRGKIDILTGGFPCQPYSVAGKRKGNEDDRHLWPEMLRAIREVQPRWVVGENVPGLASWNGGLVFEEVQTDLEAEGYKVQPVILPAASVGAPHKRDRIWFVAYSDQRSKRSSGKGGKTKGSRSGDDGKQKSRGSETEQHNGCGEFLRTSTDSDHSRTDHGNGIDRKRKAKNKGREKQPQPELRKDDVNGIATDPQSKRGRKRFGKDADGKGGKASELGQERNKVRDRDKTAGGAGVFADTEIERGRGKLQQRQGQRESGRCDSERNVTDTKYKGLQRSKEKGNIGKIGKKSKKQSARFVQPDWENFPTQSPICLRNDGISERLDTQTILETIGRKVNKRFKPFNYWRNESIKGGGNAIVPQVAIKIFKAIEKYENMH